MTNTLSDSYDPDHNVKAHNEQYLTFYLANQEYGVEILKVQGIQGWGKVTSMPNTPDYLLGVINLRGTIVPIIDVRKMFHLAKAEYNAVTVVIVVKVNYGSEERIVGLVVDAVSEVYNISSADLNPSPDFGGDVDIKYVKGLATLEEKMVILLDVDHLVGEGVLDMVNEETDPKTH
ncbi:MAG: chemotaxis protein CheW [Pseudomonadales bacterium]|nr:chemotaxis protein CheW [Pseudomonadales bacterium]